MSSAKPNPLELAKQGDPTAIAALLNRSLQSKGITAKANQEDGYLHLTLESAQVPNQQALVSFIHQGMMKLQSEAIHTVMIEAYKTGERLPAWSQELQLETGSLFQKEEMPPEEETASEEYEPEEEEIEEENEYSEESEELEEAEENQPVKEKRKSKLVPILAGVVLLLVAAVVAFVVFKPQILAMFSGEEPKPTAKTVGSQATPEKPPTTAANTSKPVATGKKSGAESSPAAATPAPTATATKPVAAPSNPWRDAVNKAMNAAMLTQSAKSSEEWEKVAKEWQAAIDLMKKVPQSSPNYEQAQQKIVEYQRNLEYAQRNATTGY
ncbi:MAG: hypothetical protein N3E45_01985 [Oscillatoriaceae bacterium SKW80]|nr:hypothetical protein [Oscillatoriaceae bacterium SKYG93]MCX8119597.1 hypothetical protein [Oscillatoriaceae bacterium SKW80]MDW8455064.1 hypothetical protein [Oscillatoriaceae cyanobacterium SKYGB_i_bin93]HIK28159.1 hypothetical protein [Oscillatoriaceae cyanobacterium M7585_C2015_266]